MIEYDLVQKEADTLKMNLIDLVCPERRCQVAKNFCERQRSIPPYERRRPIEPRVGLGTQILLLATDGGTTPCASRLQPGTPRAARAWAGMGEATPVRITV